MLKWFISERCQNGTFSWKKTQPFWPHLFANFDQIHKYFGKLKKLLFKKFFPSSIAVYGEHKDKHKDMTSSCTGQQGYAEGFFGSSMYPCSINPADYQ